MANRAHTTACICVAISMLVAPPRHTGCTHGRFPLFVCVRSLYFLLSHRPRVSRCQIFALSRQSHFLFFPCHRVFFAFSCTNFCVLLVREGFFSFLTNACVCVTFLLSRAAWVDAHTLFLAAVVDLSSIFLHVRVNLFVFVCCCRLASSIITPFIEFVLGTRL